MGSLGDQLGVFSGHSALEEMPAVLGKHCLSNSKCAPTLNIILISTRQFSDELYSFPLVLQYSCFTMTSLGQMI